MSNNKRRLLLGMSPFGSHGGTYYYSRSKMYPFDNIFDAYKDPTEYGLDGCDALLLWGGTDIHSSFYKQKRHPLNQQSHNEPMERDIVEWHLMREAYDKKIPIIGICRGAQFLCVFAGGSLYQHVYGHSSAHEITTYDNEKINAPADHHQMMDLDGVEHELLAWSSKSRSDVYEKEEKGRSMPGKHLELGEPEVVYFPKVKGLAIQPHPEWSNASDHPFNLWIMKEIARLVL